MSKKITKQLKYPGNKIKCWILFNVISRVIAHKSVCARLSSAAGNRRVCECVISFIYLCSRDSLLPRWAGFSLRSLKKKKKTTFQKWTTAVDPAPASVLRDPDSPRLSLHTSVSLSTFGQIITSCLLETKISVLVILKKKILPPVNHRCENVNHREKKTQVWNKSSSWLITLFAFLLISSQHRNVSTQSFTSFQVAWTTSHLPPLNLSMTFNLTAVPPEGVLYSVNWTCPQPKPCPMSRQQRSCYCER